MNRFTLVDPATLPPLTLIAVPDKEVILRQRLVAFKALWQSYDPPLGAAYDVENLEFDPNRIIQETGTAREINALTFVNQMGKATTLALGWGDNLDAIGSRYPGGVPRLNKGEPSQETDDRYRYRMWLSANAYSTAGAMLAYVFKAMTTVAELRDVTAVVDRGSLLEEPVITVTCLQDDADLLAFPDKVAADPTLVDDWLDALVAYDPVSSDDVLLAVQGGLSNRSNIPLTDVVAIRAATVIHTTYTIHLLTFPYADQVAALAAVKLEIAKVIEGQRYLGVDNNRAMIIAACNQYGVQNVIVVSPPADIAASEKEFIKVDSVTIGVIGTAA